MKWRSASYSWLWLVLLWNSPVLAQTQPGACSLLAKAEIAAVQGQPVAQVKESSPQRKGIVVSQCFYTANPFEKSVSLEVTRGHSFAPDNKGPKQRWMTLFHPAGARMSPAEAKGSKGAGESKKHSEGRPRFIDGIGDEAFWMGDRLTGALFVLKGDLYFRLSVGGWQDEATRLEKTKALAQLASKRL